MKRIRLVTLPIQEELLEAFEDQTKNLSPEDKQIVIEEEKEKRKFSFRNALLMVMRSPLNQQTGVSIEEMERSLEVINAIKQVKDGGILELDDDKFAFMEQKLGAVRLNGFDERWVTLKRTLKTATKDVLDESNNGTSEKEETV